MRTSVLSSLLLSVLACTTACSEDKKDGDETGETRSEWSTIVQGSWKLAAGEEKERDCFKHKLEEDVWVTAIRPIHPFGTHHTLITLGDEKTECTTAVANGLLYAAGVGSEGLTLPPGVAIKLPKGKYLGLGLHIYNPTEDPIEGTSGLQIKTADADDVEYESEAVLAGPVTISLEPQKKQTVTGMCKMEAEQHFFALFPHMHQLGTHFKTTLNISGKDHVIHDADYAFEEQYQIPLEPEYTLGVGDTVKTECTFVNTHNKTIGFGESSDREMCFSILFRYPAQGKGFCSSGQGMALPGPACAKEGDTGNDKGVGQFCTKGGNECAQDSFASFCLADVASGEFANFCTSTCADTSECGEGASCLGGSSGQRACIPTHCSLGAPDGGAN
jgi:hypothetical protein